MKLMEHVEGREREIIGNMTDIELNRMRAREFYMKFDINKGYRFK